MRYNENNYTLIWSVFIYRIFVKLQATASYDQVSRHSFFFSLLEQLCFTYNMSLMHILSKSVYTYVKL